MFLSSDRLEGQRIRSERRLPGEIGEVDDGHAAVDIVAVEAGKTDPADTSATAELAAAVDAAATELVAHGEHEERFVHPLLRAHAASLADALDAAHVDLDTRLDQLRQVAASSRSTPTNPNVLYRALAAFAATYLEYLAIEENEALPVLWEGCSDEELMSILISFKGSRSDVDNLTSLLAQLPALNPTEIAQMAGACLTVSTAEVAELLGSLLDPQQLGALRVTHAATPAIA